MDFLDLADHTRLDELYGGAINSIRVDLDAHLGHAPFALGVIGEASHLVQIVGKRLLAVNMFAQAQRRHANGRVHVVRHRDIHRIKVVSLLPRGSARCAMRLALKGWRTRLRSSAISSPVT